MKAKQALVGITAVVGMSVAGSALAVDSAAAMKLAQEKACLSCHSVDKKIVGPAFKEVAAKYKGNKGAEAKLVEKVMKGGSGVWGQIPMPPNNVTKEQAKELVDWVLSL